MIETIWPNSLISGQGLAKEREMTKAIYWLLEAIGLRIIDQSQ
jgi:hypothetical protein